MKTDPITTLTRLTSDELRERLRKLAAETKAVRVLLRAAIARERGDRQLAERPMRADTLPDELTTAAEPIALAPIVRLLLTPKEAAAALGISPRLLWSKTKIGEIPCLRIGKAVRYSPATLQAWIESAAK